MTRLATRNSTSDGSRTSRAARLLLAGALSALLFCFCSCRKAATGETATQEFEIRKSYERGPVKVDVRISKKEITIAERITLVLEATAQEDCEVELPRFGEKLEQFGIVDYSSPLPKLLGSGRVLTRRSYVLEPFLSGEYKIPPMRIVFRDKSGGDQHELETEDLAVTVKSLLPEKVAELEIEDIAGPVELPRRRQAWVYVVLVAGAVLAGGVIAFLVLRRRRTEAAIRLPADEIAYRELERLLAEKLIEKGEIKLFYMRVSDVLRHYIENRFSLHAPERTTEEFLEEIRADGVFAEAQRTLLEEFLRHCDLVKFAEHEPTNEQIQKTFDACKEFIEATKLRAPEHEAVEATTQGRSA